MTDPSFYTLIVKGMSCKHCEAAVTEAAQSVPGVTAATVNLEDGMISVQGGEPDAVIQAITKAGYSAHRP
ncbi:MAG: heavy metal-associated domain-containing protein [Candidatus Electrothrix sp. GW3-4]|uniref:heavy-metal-associated domain-containing protein n=1 Tax=Candidatus Electrothrix sp. GW3-4 TaxID=3126740 RepID=UPI0030D61BE5